jgi:putative phage-type endonuclease
MMTREQWLEERSGFIGASEAAAVLGLDPRTSAMEVYARKRGVWGERDSTEAMQWGLILESPIAEEYAKRTGRTVTRNTTYEIARLPGYPHIACTPDAWIDDPVRGRGILQIKTTGAWRESDWKSGVPDRVQVQVQQEILCCQVKWASVAALIGGQRLVCSPIDFLDVELHEPFCDRVLIPALERFWFNVKNGTPPAADNSDSCRKALGNLYPLDNGEEVILGDDFHLLDERRCEIGAALEALKTEKDGIDNKIRFAIGAATFGVLPSGTRYACRNKHVNGYTRTVKPYDYRDLRRSPAKGGGS